MQKRASSNGLTEDRPLVIGRENGDTPRLVETTGLAFGIHKGKQRWVTGDDVDTALVQGLFIEIVVGGWDDIVPRGYTPGEVTTMLLDEAATASATPARTDTGMKPETLDPKTTPLTSDPERHGPEPDDEPEPDVGDPPDDTVALQLADAHDLYDSEGVADMAIPATLTWIGDDVVRAEVVEARESNGQGRKGILNVVTAMLDAE